MKKINKMNVNGEVYDIQDNSSGYLLPKDIENLASKDLVNEKFQEAVSLGFKIEVVEALPTENISHQVIYLVLNGDNEENNIYDEFVYNSNDEWEKIGSTKTDLSNYYNKQEVDEKIKPLEVLTLEPIVNNSNISVNVGKDAYPKLTDDNKTKIIDGVNKLLNSDFQYAHLPFYFYPRNYPLLIDILLDKDKILTNKNINTYHNVLGGDNTNNQYNFWFNITFSMENNVVTAIASSNISARVNQVSMVNNTQRYDITNDYNPAHKFYVDTSVVYDWVNNNIRYWQSSVSYLVGDIVYSSSYSKYYKCLKDHKSSSSIYFNIDNWQELTEEELEAFKRPTKQYVDDAIIGSVLSITNIQTSESKAILQKIYDEWLNGIILNVNFVDNNGRVYKLESVSVWNNTISFVFNTGIDTSNAGSLHYGTVYSFVLKAPLTDGVIGSVSYSGTSFDMINGNYVSLWALTKSNTSAYNVTHDYNPAHKKYVDDSVITKIVIDLNLTEEEIIAQLQELYNTYLANKKYICKIINAFGSAVADVTISQLTSTRFQLAWVMNESGRTQIRYGIPYYIQRNYTLYVYFDKNNAITSYNLSNNYRGNVICSDGKDFVGELPLGINNTSEYTPTKGSYNPATAKYAEDIPTTYVGYDATKTQVLKNINGVLTWVDEEA